jgi:acyl-[acyl-carrier-protein]-phospholipid O-acyltransferase/long-chain-fatty-acid--[acyl-carrier-protein] ligase
MSDMKLRALLRYALVGAEKLRDSVAATFREKFNVDLLEGYGCTEMAPVVSVNVPDYTHGTECQKGSKPGLVGHPLPGVTVKIVHPETGENLPCNQDGLLLVRGPNMMLGYLGQPEKTKEAFRDGWYITGDIGSIDNDGFIRLTDRLSRFSKIGGEMVPHINIEEGINQACGEYPCVVTAVPDEQKGEILIVLYTHPTLTVRELWEFLSQKEIPKLWVPKQENFYFIDSIPMLGTGKVDLKKAKSIALDKKYSNSTVN